MIDTWRDIKVFNRATGEVKFINAPSLENALLFEAWQVYGGESNEMPIERSETELRLGTLFVKKGEE